MLKPAPNHHLPGISFTLPLHGNSIILIAEIAFSIIVFKLCKISDCRETALNQLNSNMNN